MLDGGALLQRIPWTQGATYHDLCTVYTDYVERKYGEAIIIFDGYDEMSTKDMTHLMRRNKEQAGVNVTFTQHEESNFSGKQYEQAKIHQHAWQLPRKKEMQGVPCSTGC